jgi:hypothetical protein
MNWDSLKWRVAWIVMWVFACSVSLLAIYFVIRDLNGWH